ncbi:MAG: ribosome maturation factor RimM [Gammaproteobacteria bacterium]|nr:ribosome maturation factor RimM [Gammaproteobacteria bacterium]
MTSDNDFIVVGKISGLYGVRGWVRVFSYTQPRENITTYKTWYLQDGSGWTPFELESGRLHSKGVVAKLVGYDDRDQAIKLQQKTIAIKREQLAKLQEGEYYWEQLVGLKVTNLQDIELGTIDSMLETGANDVMVVKDPNKAPIVEQSSEEEQERLIPFVQGDIIKRIDLDSGTMLVDWDADF